ncbi:MAG: DNA polymerase V [Candidatus Amoebophilus sp. 36-38]|nr:MAG: DNA polymerase V [Candidatus Amoebophilus sp. 36-38]
MLVLYIILAFSLGILVSWYLATNRWQLQNKTLHLKLEQSEQQLEETKSVLEQAKTQELQLNTQLAKLETINTNLATQLAEQKEEVNKIEDKLSIQFKNLANDLLEEKSKKFTDQNKVNLETLLKPLGERIQSFEKQIEQTNKEGLERNVALRTEISRLYTLNMQITKEAENLAKAIKGDTKIQGNWGEFILESILEKSGLIKDREYQIQASFVTEDGKRYQPDVIIKLPAAKHLIIDAKVSLINYEQFFNTEESEEKLAQLKKHLVSVRKHIDSLSEKNYQTQYSLQGLDFVLMFIPIEPAFSLVVQHDSTIFSEAYEKNIIIVSPSTLIATLRTISNIWRQEYQNQNALEIAHQSGALYDKFVGFIEDLKQVGRQLDLTQKSYVEAMKKLYDGKGNLVKRVENIKSLGARTTKAIDQQLLDRADVKQIKQDL